ncbi:four helix bundle protein [uncultured Algibacter sp.]|uniref:four helix bundle protein n=1 Tax=uncultured Algibacter sp. TaxID=298659 RepID=UPI00341285EF
MRQKSMDVVTIIYKLVKQFPDDEKFGLTSQIKRSSVSVPSNIAEGYGRNYTKDYTRFLNIARGSLYEMQTQLQVAFNLGFIVKEDLNKINVLSVEVEKMLNSLINKLAS